MFNILVTSEIDEQTMERFAQRGKSHFQWTRVVDSLPYEEFLHLLSSTDCYITKNRDLCDSEYEIAKELKLFQLPISGYDKIDLERAKRYGVPVANNGGANAISVSEHVFLLILAIYRNFLIHHNSVVDGTWINLKYSNLEMAKKTIGIIGLGNIGKEVAKRACAFQMNVIYNDILPPDPAFNDKYNLKYMSFENVMKKSDIVTFHVPLNSDTKNMICEESLRLMKPKAVLINAARGSIQNEDDLYKVLSKKQILGAGLDVFNREPLPLDSPLLTLENVVFTPHSGPSYESQFRMIDNVIGNLARVAQGENPTFIVN